LLSLEFLALGVWIGGLIVLVGAVIPAVFNTWGGQESGGFFLTRAFEGYNRLVVVALILLLGAMGYRQWRGEAAATVSRGEWILLSAMGGIAGVIICRHKNDLCIWMKQQYPQKLASAIAGPAKYPNSDLVVVHS